MSRPSKKRQREQREAERDERRLDRYAEEARMSMLHALQTWSYVVCEACGMEQGQYAEGRPRPCVFCGYGLARYHPETVALRASFRPGL